MKNQTLRHVLLTVAGCFFVLNSSPLFAQLQDSSEIIVVKNLSASRYVAAVTINGVRYISLPDLVRMFGLNYFYNPTTKKMEIKLSSAEVKLAAENAFIVVTDRATRKQTPLQLSVPTHSIGDTLYAPLLAFLPVFNSISKTELAVDTAREMNTAGADSTGKLGHFDVSGVFVESKKNGYLVRIRSSIKVSDADRFIREENWLYVTLPNVRVDTTGLDTLAPGPMVEQVLAVQSQTSAQIAIRFRKKISSSEIVPDETTNDILVSVQTVTPPSKKELAAERKRRQEEAAKKEEDQQDKLQTQLDTQRKKWKLDVIVLDAGHGGNDPGTLGTIGTREKDITLGIVLKLGKLIAEKLPEVKVVYTRKTDRFVELYRRGQIANENQGKLFISIHCNSLEQKPSATNGFEIYLLRPGKTDDAIKIAQKENAVVRLEQDFQNRYQDITDENFIILTMAQSAYVRQSEQFASFLEEEMGKKLSEAGHGVKQAGFYVLVGASMPNVLVETGYLSNRKDEMFLRSPSGQQVVAESILNAIRTYKEAYEKTLKEGS